MNREKSTDPPGTCQRCVQKPARDGTVEWCSRVGTYFALLLEELGFAEYEHNPRNNRIRAL
ncbi:DUF6855 family protein [Arthrobacter polaris]|uniref:DUF6855 family protein n=1 Tax=Arthrobacter polaris TaxID=2813727 RepID=UPI002AFF9B55|nr:hypothetical protein [Arthrobacter polaris]